MNKFWFYSSVVLLCMSFLVLQSQSLSEEKEFIIGEQGSNYLLPQSIDYRYESKLFEGEKILIDYNGEKKTFQIIKRNQTTAIDDAVFSELKVSPYDFDLREFNLHKGTDEPPLKCQTVYFGVVEDELIVGGSYQMCESSPPVLRLHSNKEHPIDSLLIVYNSSVSDEVHPDGFWTEITDGLDSQK